MAAYELFNDLQRTTREALEFHSKIIEERQGINIVSPFPQFDFPRFDGSHLRGWILKCEAFFRVFPNIDDDQRIKLATVNFEGRAAQWFQKFKEKQMEITWYQFLEITWYQFLEIICARFEDIRETKIFAELNKLKQTGTYVEYEEKFNELKARMLMLNQRECLENYFIEKFRSGLSEELQEFISLFEPTTLQQNIELGRLITEKITHPYHFHQAFENDPQEAVGAQYLFDEMTISEKKCSSMEPINHVVLFTKPTSTIEKLNEKSMKNNTTVGNIMSDSSSHPLQPVLVEQSEVNTHVSLMQHIDEGQLEISIKLVKDRGKQDVSRGRSCNIDVRTDSSNHILMNLLLEMKRPTNFVTENFVAEPVAQKLDLTMENLGTEPNSALANLESCACEKQTLRLIKFVKDKGRDCCGISENSSRVLKTNDEMLGNQMFVKDRGKRAVDHQGSGIVKNKYTKHNCKLKEGRSRLIVKHSSRQITLWSRRIGKYLICLEWQRWRWSNVLRYQGQWCNDSERALTLCLQIALREDRRIKLGPHRTPKHNGCNDSWSRRIGNWPILIRFQHWRERIWLDLARKHVGCHKLWSRRVGKAQRYLKFGRVPIREIITHRPRTGKRREAWVVRIEKQRRSENVRTTTGIDLTIESDQVQQQKEAAEFLFFGHTISRGCGRDFSFPAVYYLRNHLWEEGLRPDPKVHLSNVGVVTKLNGGREEQWSRRIGHWPKLSQIQHRPERTWPDFAWKNEWRRNSFSRRIGLYPTLVRSRRHIQKISGRIVKKNESRRISRQADGRRTEARLERIRLDLAQKKEESWSRRVAKAWMKYDGVRIREFINHHGQLRTYERELEEAWCLRIAICGGRESWSLRIAIEGGQKGSLLLMKLMMLIWVKNKMSKRRSFERRSIWSGIDNDYGRWKFLVCDFGCKGKKMMNYCDLQFWLPTKTGNNFGIKAVGFTCLLGHNWAAAFWMGWRIKLVGCLIELIPKLMGLGIEFELMGFGSFIWLIAWLIWAPLFSKLDLVYWSELVVRFQHLSLGDKTL